MKNYILLLTLCLCTACTPNKKIVLNEVTQNINDFYSVDTLAFEPVCDSILGFPDKILRHGDYLIIQMSRRFGHLIETYSLTENRIVSKNVKYGEAPNEFLACDMVALGDNLWLYDMSKRRLGRISLDSIKHISDNSIHTYDLQSYYYRFAMLNDSLFLGSNNMEEAKKLSYVNIKTGEAEMVGEYAYLDNNINKGVLIDAASCYVDVNPQTKDIALSYRYTDILEVYDASGNIKWARQGPAHFDIEFRPGRYGMAKTKKTQKAYVNTYVTAENIYLLYSGCHKAEKNWSYGTEIFAISWQGEPLKKLVLPAAIYAFAIDEANHLLYAYNVENETLVKARI